MFEPSIKLKYVLTLLIFGELPFRHLKEQWGVLKRDRGLRYWAPRVLEPIWNFRYSLEWAILFICSTSDTWGKSRTVPTVWVLQFEDSPEWILASLIRATLNSREFPHPSHLNLIPGYSPKGRILPFVGILTILYTLGICHRPLFCCYESSVCVCFWGFGGGFFGFLFTFYFEIFVDSYADVRNNTE